MRPPQPRHAALAALLVLAAAFGAAGCDVLMGDDPFEEQIVVTGVLVAGRPISPITLTRTVPIGAFYEPSYVVGAVVTVELLAEDGTTEAIIPYIQIPEGPYVPVLQALVLGGRTYRLLVVVPGLTDAITAETTVPTELEILEGLPDSVAYQDDVRPGLRTPASVYPGRQGIYLYTLRPLDPIEFDRVDDPSTEEEGDSLWVQIPGTGYAPVPFVETLIEEQDLSPESFIVLNSQLLSESTAERNPDGTLTLRLTWGAVSFYGPLEVTATAVDDALVRFFQSQAIQTLPTTLSPGEIPNVDSNVENGLGLFGSVAQIRDSTFILPEAGRRLARR